MGRFFEKKLKNFFKDFFNFLKKYFFLNFPNFLKKYFFLEFFNFPHFSYFLNFSHFPHFLYFSIDFSKYHFLYHKLSKRFHRPAHAHTKNLSRKVTNSPWWNWTLPSIKNIFPPHFRPVFIFELFSKFQSLFQDWFLGFHWRHNWRLLLRFCSKGKNCGLGLFRRFPCLWSLLGGRLCSLIPPFIKKSKNDKSKENFIFWIKSKFLKKLNFS